MASPEAKVESGASKSEGRKARRNTRLPRRNRSDSFPSCYDYRKLLKWVKNDTEESSITSEQLAALGSMRNIATDTVPLTDPVLNDFASSADKVLFRSSLMRRVKICLTEEGVLHKQDRLGHTACLDDCLEYQQVHRAKIELDPIREPPDLSDAQLRERLLSVLVHELCHAYLSIFVERGTLFVQDRLRALGVDGHGQAFADLFESIASVLRSHNVIDLNLELHSQWMVRRDQEKQSNLVSLGSMFELPDLSDGEKEDILVEQLNVSHEKARTFPQLLHEGYTTLEAVVKVSGLVWDGDWRPHMKGLLQLDGDVE